MKQARSGELNAELGHQRTRRTEGCARALPARRAAAELGRSGERARAFESTPGRRRGTAEFLGRDEDACDDTVTEPCRSRAAGNGSLADPADVFGAARVADEEMTPAC